MKGGSLKPSFKTLSKSLSPKKSHSS